METEIEGGGRKLLRLEYVRLEELRRWPRNPKAHSIADLGDSMERWGYTDPILYDERAERLVAGHGRLDTLWEKFRAAEEPPEWIGVDDDGHWLVPVVRGWESTSDDEAEAYLLADNELTIAPGWDRASLLEMSKDLISRDVSFKGTGFDPVALMKEAEKAIRDGTATPEEKPEKEAPELEPPPNPVTRPGDVWELGPHRLMCGDSTKAEDVDRLLDGARVMAVVTDPPFAIYGSSTGITPDIADDKMVRPFFEALFRTIHRVLPTFGHVYVNTDWRTWAAMWEAARRAQIAAKNMLVWDKGDQGLGSMYAQCHELVFFGSKSPPQTAMKSTTKRGERTVYRPNMLRFPRVQGKERQHNAAKPVDMLGELITNSTEPGDGVLDLFGGSGSTLMACEGLKRRAYLMEIEAKWCDVIVKRWETATGQKATRRGAAKTRKRKAVAS